MNGAKILNGIASLVWAITEEKLGMILEVLEARIAGESPLSTAEIDEIMAASTAGVDGRARDQILQREGPIAIMNLSGILSMKANLVTRFSGGTSTQQFGTVFREMVEDPSVRTILVSIDSPGGSVEGVRELSDQLYRARGSKRIVAIADPMAASGAYWIGTAASEFYVTPSGQVGSVGAVAIHVDETKALEKRGLGVTVIRAGEHKMKGSPYEALDADAISQIQASVNEYRDMFIAAVTRNRAGASAKHPRDFGAGLMYRAEGAVRAGMADGVSAFQDLFDGERERLSRDRRFNQARAELAISEISAAGN